MEKSIEKNPIVAVNGLLKSKFLVTSKNVRRKLEKVIDKVIAYQYYISVIRYHRQ